MDTGKKFYANVLLGKIKSKQWFYIQTTSEQVLITMSIVQRMAGMAIVYFEHQGLN
jgi:hypothetical protein